MAGQRLAQERGQGAARKMGGQRVGKPLAGPAGNLPAARPSGLQTVPPTPDGVLQWGEGVRKDDPFAGCRRADQTGRIGTEGAEVDHHRRRGIPTPLLAVWTPRHPKAAAGSYFRAFVSALRRQRATTSAELRGCTCSAPSSWERPSPWCRGSTSRRTAVRSCRPSAAGWPGDGVGQGVRG